MMMSPALWGSLSALSLGTADFSGRFTARAVGADVALLGIFGIGSLLMSAWVLYSGADLVWVSAGYWLIATNGVATMLMTLLLYTALARGPVSVVAPIVASHPALVVLAWFALGHRPGNLQWLGIVLTIIGAVVVAKTAYRFRGDDPAGRKHLGTTLVMACVACVVYVAMVMGGQLAVPIYGDLQTLWMGRVVSLVCIVTYLLVRRTKPVIPQRWWPLITAQSCLDTAGFVFLFTGSHGEGSEIAAVTGSAFGAVTAILARVVLKEDMSFSQWGGVILVFTGIVALSWP